MNTTEDAAYEIAQWAKFDAQCAASGEIEMTDQEYADLVARVQSMGLSAFAGAE